MNTKVIIIALILIVFGMISCVDRTDDDNNVKIEQVNNSDLDSSYHVSTDMMATGETGNSKLGDDDD